LFFIPLMAAAVYLLARDLDSTAAHVSRWALVPFVVFYSAWETLQGIANGVLVEKVNELPRGNGQQVQTSSRTSRRARSHAILGHSPFPGASG
jgi:hypothetical protein